jgi:hypothetical protein
MAKLPDTVQAVAPRGARLSPGVVQPGMGLANGLQDVGAAVDQIAQAQSVRDGKAADRALLKAQQDFEPAFAERSAMYDGRQPGFASAENTFFDAHFQQALDDKGLSDGVRFAMRQKLDALKLQFGQRAIGVEMDKRAGVVADQERVKTQARLTQAEIGFDSAYQAKSQARIDAYDGSDGNFAKNLMADFTDAQKAALDAAPDDLKPLLQARLAAKSVTANAQALEMQDKGRLAYMSRAAGETLNGLSNNVLTNPASYDSAVTSLQAAAELVPAGVRQKFLDEGRGQLAAYRVDGLIQKGDYAQAQAELADGRYDKWLPAGAKERLVDAVRERSSQRAKDLIEALTFGGDVNADQLTQAARISDDPGLQAKADWALAVGSAEPGALGALAGGGTRKGFAEAAGFVIDQLEGGDAVIPNDNGHGVSRFGINQDANPDLKVQGLTRGQAVARYAKYWKAVGASRLPPGLAIAAFDAAVLFGPDDANRWVGQSGGDVGQLLALEHGEMQRLAKADPAKYGDDLKGWENRLGKVRAEAARRQAFANVEEGLSSDPVKFALGSDSRAPIAAVPPLPDDPSGPAFQQALRGRAQLAGYMAKQYRAPYRFLTNAEAAQLGQQIDADPLRAVGFAEDALAAVGPQGAKLLMGELGEKNRATVTLHLADLAAGGLTAYAAQAARGLKLKSENVELAAEHRKDITQEVSLHTALFEGAPELRMVVEQTAQAAMLVDQQAGKLRDPSYYVNGALGASSKDGRMFGGVAHLNGAQAVLPSWLAQDHADDAMEALGQMWAGWAQSHGGDPQHAGPVYGDGTAVSARDIARMRLQLLPNGNYRILDRRGAALMGRGTGRPFEFDMDAARVALRQRLGPNAVAGP